MRPGAGQRDGRPWRGQGSVAGGELRAEPTTASRTLFDMPEERSVKCIIVTSSFSGRLPCS